MGHQWKPPAAAETEAAMEIPFVGTIREGRVEVMEAEAGGYKGGTHGHFFASKSTRHCKKNYCKWNGMDTWDRVSDFLLSPSYLRSVQF